MSDHPKYRWQHETAESYNDRPSLQPEAGYRVDTGSPEGAWHVAGVLPQGRLVWQRLLVKVFKR